MAIATALAIGSLAATAASTAMSFDQAGKQKNAQRNAERDAEQAMQEARKKLEKNFYDTLSIQKEPYELEREALLSQGAQAIQAGVESERGAAATAGRIQMAQQEGQAGIRTAMGQDLLNLQKLSAQEESRLRDIGVQLDLGEVSGAQLAAANAQELGAQAQQQAFQGVTSLGQQAVSYLPLFEKQTTQMGNALKRVPGQMEQTIATSRGGITPTQAPQTINPNIRPVNMTPMANIVPNRQPRIFNPIGGNPFSVFNNPSLGQ
jgi:type II secretory pathway pseudopilin PulG